MSKQPEALRLAEEYYDDHWIVGTKQWCRETAEELRRLHEINAELVRTMQTIRNISLMNSGDWAKTIEQEVCEAIAKATGEQP